MKGLASLEAIITIAAMIFLIFMVITSISGMTKTWNMRIERGITSAHVDELVYSEYVALGANTTRTGWYIEHNGS